VAKRRRTLSSSPGRKRENARTSNSRSRRRLARGPGGDLRRHSRAARTPPFAAWRALWKPPTRPAHRRARFGPNNRSWQFTRDILLIEKIHQLKSSMEKKGGAEVKFAAVFDEIERLKWTGATIYGWLAENPSLKRFKRSAAWSSETAAKRYSEAKSRFNKGFASYSNKRKSK
jgi:hypothetical protein